MGGAQSAEPRSVSLENPHPSSGVIDVSDEVVERLKAGIKKQVRDNAAKKEAQKPAPAPAAHAASATTSAAPNLPPPKTEAPRISKPIPIKPVLAPVPPLGARGTQVYLPPSGISLTAADVLRQKEIELEQNDAYWRERIEKLEGTLAKTNSVMEKEFDAAVEDVQKSFINAAPVHQLPPCQDLKAKVIACYRENPRETLNCADIVANFNNCINLHRIKNLESEEAKTAATTTKVAKGA